MERSYTHNKNKIAKNLGLPYRAKQLLYEESLKIIYFSYIIYYLNYANVAWANTYYTKLKTIHYQEKYAVRILINTFQAIRDLFYYHSMLSMFIK